MVGIAVISHGGLCEGILDSVSMVAGTMEQTESVSLKPGVSPDTYKEELRETIQRLDTGDGVVVFVDLMGGTPFNTICMPVSYTHLRAHETDSYLVCRLLLEKKKKKKE